MIAFLRPVPLRLAVPFAALLTALVGTAVAEAAATRDSIDIVESDPTDQVAPRITKLSTAGLAKIAEGLRAAASVGRYAGQPIS
jgi:hypothetical protein